MGAQAESTTAGDSRGLPRYKDGRGGASSTGQGGSEGASGGPNKPFNAGALLDRNGDGSYRVSEEFMKMAGNRFRDTFGFDPSGARVEFGWAYGSPAYTYKNTIVIDPTSSGWSTGFDSVAQADLLVHELTHCVQYERGGAVTVMARRFAEDVKYGKDAYTPSARLIRTTDLRSLNVVDPGFTIESVAKFVEGRFSETYQATSRRRL